MQRLATSFVVFALATAGAGCTVIRQTQQVHATEGRIDDKTDKLSRATKEQAALQEQTKEIQADLDTRTLSANELEKKLSDLQASNARAATNTEAQVKRQKALEAALSKAKANLKALQQNGDYGVAEKQRHLEAVEEQAKREIDLASQIQ